MIHRKYFIPTLILTVCTVCVVTSELLFSGSQISYLEFIKLVKQGQIRTVSAQNTVLTLAGYNAYYFTDKNARRFVVIPEGQPLVAKISSHSVDDAAPHLYRFLVIATLGLLSLFGLADLLKYVAKAKPFSDKKCGASKIP